jgi:hypothetical protein
MSHARVLAEVDVVGHALLELVADHLLVAAELVDTGIAGEQAGRNFAERRVGDGADIGQEVLGPRIAVRGHAEHGEAGVGVGPPGHRRGEEEIVVVDVVGLGAAALGLADQAILHLPAAGLCRRAADVELGIGVAEIIDAGLDVANGLG